MGLGIAILLLVLALKGGSGTAGAPAGPPAWVNAPGLNLRAAPDRSAVIITSLGQGEQVEVIGSAVAANGAAWSRVRARGQEGWVSTSYLAGIPIPRPHLDSAIAAPAGQDRPADAPAEPRITLQYQMPADADNLAAIRRALTGQPGWRVGQAERVLPAGENRPETYAGVRFFFESDSGLARTVCEAVIADLGRQGYAVTLPIWPMLTRQRMGLFNARPGLIEVWIDPLPAEPVRPEQRPVAGQCGR